MTIANRYTRMKFDQDFGNYIERERERGYRTGMGVKHKPREVRYCEAGQHYVKRTGGKVNKGWRCRTCSSTSATQ